MNLRAFVEFGSKRTAELAPDFAISWGNAEPPRDFAKYISDVSLSSWARAPKSELTSFPDSGIYGDKDSSGIDFPAVPEANSWESWRSWQIKP